MFKRWKVLLLALPLLFVVVVGFFLFTKSGDEKFIYPADYDQTADYFYLSGAEKPTDGRSP